MRRKSRRVLFQGLLFITTFVTTTLAGAQWVYGVTIFSGNFTWEDFIRGLPFSVPLLLILTAHEFGHYFVALYHRVKSSLPYYIPIPPIPYFPVNLGTMGAVIRLRSRPASNVQTFDIGVAGPIAGFVVALAIMVYGFRTLPPPEYVFSFHPEYEQFGEDYADVVYSESYMREQGLVLDLSFGNNLLFWIFSEWVADPDRVPNERELMHYPVLLACYIALFVTCLNLLPIGQLDGGHVIYGLFGFRVHRVIARLAFLALIFYAGLGLPYINPALPSHELLPGIALYVLFLFLAFRGLNLPTRDTLMFALLIFASQFALMSWIPGVRGYEGWLLFAFILGRVIGVEHPRSEIEKPLDPTRIVIGWLALLIFVLCFSPAPIRIAPVMGAG